MARFSLDEGTSGRKRKKSSSEEEEDLESIYGRVEGETSEAQEEEEEEPDEVGDEEEEGDGEVGDEVEDDEEMQKTGEGVGFRGANTNGGFNFRIDPDVLDCSICFEPLRPPIFQCRNGHIACSDCCPKLLNKCHVCHRPIGRLRCISLEKVVESIMSPCQYASHGCRSILSFADKVSHESACRYAALFCPISNCTFSGPTNLLFAHANDKHGNISRGFTYYNKHFMITLEKKQPSMALLGDDGHFFLLLNSHENEFCHGNVLSMICIASNHSKHEFSYELRVTNGKSSLHLRTSPEKFKKWNGVHPSKAFLLVPDGFCASSARLNVSVCIYKSSGVLI